MKYGLGFSDEKASNAARSPQGFSPVKGLSRHKRLLLYMRTAQNMDWHLFHVPLTVKIFRAVKTVPKELKSIYEESPSLFRSDIVARKTALLTGRFSLAFLFRLRI